MKYCYCDTPIGNLLIAGDKEGIKLVSFPKGSQKKKPFPEWTEDSSFFKRAITEFKKYFTGELKKFSVPIVLEGTPFQLSVWKELKKISYGTTTNYGELARRIGNPKAARAVGMANRCNPIPVIIPCHRVIGKNGSLTGFGGGLPTKQKLLELEKKFVKK